MSYKKNWVTAIVPVYNEEKTLENVIKSLLGTRIIDAIIAIDDGSTDKSKEILGLLKDRIVVLTNNCNKGKGHAVARGLKKAKPGMVLLLDADILNYSKKEITDLIRPVVEKRCDYTMRTRKGLIVPKLFKSTSGVRCYWRKDLYPLIAKMRQSHKYGLEELLNAELASKSYKLIVFSDSRHVAKLEKLGLFRAIKEYLKELWDILLQKNKL